MATVAWWPGDLDRPPTQAIAGYGPIRVCRMATVRAGSFVDAVRFSVPVRFAGPVRFVRFTGSRASPVRAVRPKSEIVMKMIAVRAVETPISAFCNEFRCESFRDDRVFQFV